MRGNAVSFGCAAIFGVMLASTASQAAIVGITSLAGNDSINWSQLGPVFTVLTGPQNVTSGGGLGAIASSAGGVFERRDEGNGWAGNFTPGTALLWDQGIGPDITLTFANPVVAVGAQIQSDFFGAFTAQVFGGNGVELATFTEDGESNTNEDNSAIFIGLRSDVANIVSIEFTLTNAPNGSTQDFVIGPAVLLTGSPAIPEPSTWALMLIGFAGLGFAACRQARKNHVASTIA